MSNLHRHLEFLGLGCYFQAFVWYPSNIIVFDMHDYEQCRLSHNNFLNYWKLPYEIWYLEKIPRMSVFWIFCPQSTINSFQNYFQLCHSLAEAKCSQRLIRKQTWGTRPKIFKAAQELTEIRNQNTKYRQFWRQTHIGSKGIPEMWREQMEEYITLTNNMVVEEFPCYRQTHSLETANTWSKIWNRSGLSVLKIFQVI